LRTPSAPGPPFTIASDIDNTGDVVGGSELPTTNEFAVLWKPDGTIVNLGFGIVGAATGAEASGISNSGKIVGLSLNANNLPPLPTLFDGKGEQRILAVPAC
jgi:uncharacterized membrane protein